MWPPVYSRPPLSPSVDTSQHTQLRGISLHAGGSLFSLWDGDPKGKKTGPVWYRTCAVSPSVSHVKTLCAWKAAQLPDSEQVPVSLRCVIPWGPWRGAGSSSKWSGWGSCEMSWEDLDSAHERSWARGGTGAGGRRKKLHQLGECVAATGSMFWTVFTAVNTVAAQYTYLYWRV